ncbi:hypothetical protein [Vibrio sp. F74]|uniref:hypothetical protein n=1 Tax=Vibrio sp. F74 TaxID=700020 RepID=UPI0035F5F9D3
MKLIRVHLPVYYIFPFRIVMGLFFIYFSMQVIDIISDGSGMGNGGFVFEKDKNAFGYYLVLMRDVAFGLLFFWLATFGTKKRIK